MKTTQTKHIAFINKTGHKKIKYGIKFITIYPTISLFLDKWRTRLKSNTKYHKRNHKIVPDKIFSYISRSNQKCTYLHLRPTSIKICYFINLRIICL